jgi:hypothetical protein
MSGGYIDEQQKYDHQVVIFTFVGQINEADIKAWNLAVAQLKGHFKARVTGITLKGAATPLEHREKSKRKR